MYSPDYMALRQQYMSMPPGPAKAQLGLKLRSMQAEAENEYDSATGAETGDAQPQMVEIGNDVSGVPSNALIQAAPQQALVSAAVQYKQPGKGQGRLRPSPLAMAEINAKAVARGKQPPYNDNELVKVAEKNAKVGGNPQAAQIMSDGFSRQSQMQQPQQNQQQVPETTLPPTNVNAQRNQLPDIIPQNQEAPQGPAAAESPGRQGIPQLPGSDQRIADIEERIKNGTATVNDQLMLQMLKGQANRQQQQMLPPGYGDMGMARAGMAGLVNPGYKDVEDDAKQFLPSLIQMLGNLNRINRG